MSKDSSNEVVHEEQTARKRRSIASFFRQLADRLSHGERVAVDAEQEVAVEVPAEPDMAVTVDEADGTVSLDIELEWSAEDGSVETDVVASKASFEVYEDSAGDYRWRLRHDNGNIIADGGEGYSSKQNALDGLESVRRNAPGAYIDDQSKDESPPEEGGSNATFELYADEADKWRWRLRHDNSNIIADSGQGYASKQKAKQGLYSVQKNTPGAPIDEE